MAVSRFFLLNSEEINRGTGSLSFEELNKQIPRKKVSKLKTKTKQQQHFHSEL